MQMMQFLVRQKLPERGHGVRLEDGLYQFKEKFGGRLMPLQAVKQIYQPDTYQRLCSEANIFAGDTTWFPASRRRIRQGI